MRISDWSSDVCSSDLNRPKLSEINPISLGDQEKTMKRILSSGALAAVLAFAATNAMADKVQVGFMLPYSGTYAALGQAIENGFKLYVQEQGGTMAGQEHEYYKVDRKRVV